MLYDYQIESKFLTIEKCQYAANLKISSEAFGVKTKNIETTVGNLHQKGDLSDGFSLKFYRRLGHK